MTNKQAMALWDQIIYSDRVVAAMSVLAPNMYCPFLDSDLVKRKSYGIFDKEEIENLLGATLLIRRACLTVEQKAQEALAKITKMEEDNEGDDE